MSPVAHARSGASVVSTTESASDQPADHFGTPNIVGDSSLVDGLKEVIG
jgi:hypothetical protein